MKVLIGYDGSTCSDDAIKDLHRAGLPARTDALVVSVGEYWMPPPSSYAVFDTDLEGAHGGELMEATELARIGRDSVAAAFPDWNVQAESRAGSPARQMLEIADEWSPDLLVVGSHGRKGLAKFFMGSVSQKVATEARCSVRIARGTAGELPEPVRIVLGIDGSEGGKAAARAVLARSWPEGSQVRVVTGIGPLSIDGKDLAGELEKVRTLHQPVVEQLEAAGLEVASRILEADPRELLIREAEEWRADAIFLGATGRLTLDRFLFGTVVAAVTARAHCSVEIVRERL